MQPFQDPCQRYPSELAIVTCAGNPWTGYRRRPEGLGRVKKRIDVEGRLTLKALLDEGSPPEHARSEVALRTAREDCAAA
jgi:hypothetical protein